MSLACGVAAAAAVLAFGVLPPPAAGAAASRESGGVENVGAGDAPGTDGAAAADSAGALPAAAALASGVPGTGYVSPALVEALGYAPGQEDGHAMRVDGSCSSPVPLPSSFEVACRSHDLGYDLLRVAHREGAPIPVDLRRSLDRQLGVRMAASCTPAKPRGLRERLDVAGCRAAASVAQAAVALNTARQHDGAPIEEALPW